MKKTLCMIIIAFLPYCLNAQITIDKPGFINWVPRVDTNQDVLLGNLVFLPNGTYDLTPSTYTAIWLYTNTAVTNPLYPDASFSTGFNTFYATTLANGLHWNATIYKGIVDSGAMSYGESVGRQAFGAGVTTGNVNDSIVFPAQNITYSTPYVNLKFPLTHTTSWKNNFTQSTEFRITIAAKGLFNEAFTFKRQTIQTDSVYAWGKMRIKNIAGVGSEYIDILAMYTYTDYKDTIMKNGIPISDSFANAIGVTRQGSSTSSFTSCYRAGQTMPLFRRFVYPPYTHTEVCLNDLPMPPTGINTVGNSNSTLLYPNPAKNQEPVFIELQQTNLSGNWTYELINISGQQTTKAPLHMVGNRARIDLAPGHPAGSYFLHILNNGNSVSTKPIKIVE